MRTSRAYLLLAAVAVVLFWSSATANARRDDSFHETEQARSRRSHDRSLPPPPLRSASTAKLRSVYRAKSTDTATDISTERVASPRLLEHSKREDQGTVKYTILPTTTNASFTADLCAKVNSTIDTLLITGIEGSFLTWPACLASSTLLEVSALYGVLVTDFSHLPTTLTSLTLSHCKLTPATSGALGFDASGRVNLPQVFARLPSLTLLSTSYTKLHTTFPESFPSKLQSVDFTWCSMTGTIPGSLLDNIFATTTNSHFQLEARFNIFNGTIPAELFSGFPVGQFDSVSFGVHGNYIEGTLPPTIFHPLQNALLKNFEFVVTQNSISGTIADALIPANLITADGEFVLGLGDNDFEGLFPSQIFAPITAFRKFELRLWLTLLNGTLPQQLFPNGWTPYGDDEATLRIYLNDNRFIGTIPATLITGGLTREDLQREASASPVVNVSATMVTLYTDGNLLEGPLPSALWNHWSPLEYWGVTLDFSSNNFSGIVPPSLTDIPKLDLFAAANNINLVGPMPPIPSPYYLDLRMTGTSVDFCTQPIALPSRPAMYSCELPTGSCGCNQSYPFCQFDSCSALPSPSIEPPITTPTSEPLIQIPIDLPQAEPLPGPVLPIVAPIIQPVSAPTPAPSCPNNTQPSSHFSCINGIWTAPSAIAPTLHVPAGAGKVIILGNLASESITIDGIGTTVDIGGSAANLTQVVIVLSPTESQTIEGNRILQILITTNGTNPSGGPSTINMNSIETSARASSGCRKPKAERTVLDGGRTLGAYLTVDSSACSRWWIVLVAVVVGVIVVILIALILLAVFYKPFRKCVRPYSARPHTAKA